MVAVGEVFLQSIQPNIVLEDQVRSRPIIVSGTKLTSARNFQFRRIIGEGALILKAFEQSKTENRVELRIITIRSAIKEGRYTLQAKSKSQKYRYLQSNTHYFLRSIVGEHSLAKR